MSDSEFPRRCSDALEGRLDLDLFKALCDPRRLALLANLAVADGPVTVSEAGQCCGEVHISGVSRHLAMLRRAGIVEAEKRGREVRYRLNASRLIATLRGLADALEECCGSSGCCD